MAQATAAPQPQNLNLGISASRQFPSWLSDENLSLAFTTYQSQLLLLLGMNQQNKLSASLRQFGRAMGLYVTPDAERMYLSTKFQLWQLDNVLKPGQQYRDCDRCYVPRVGYTTGDLDIHDVTLDSTGRILMVCTLLNCLATVSDKHSCTPLWKPPFISKLVNEDRCHLNGLAMVDGRPGYVTVVSTADMVDTWREKRRTSGCVIDLATSETVATGLSMPHSPRYYQGKLWLLNSGTGEFGYIDMDSGLFEPVTFCPGYLRGLAFWQHFAIVGLSKVRGGDGALSGLMLDELLKEKDVESRCGLMIIDLNTGAIAHWLRLEGQISEMYDVQVLPGVKRPMALGFQSDEISRLLTFDQHLNEL
ncbi:MAG: TIGR03032 family protein [Cyanobacteria bacterium J06627_15]